MNTSDQTKKQYTQKKINISKSEKNFHHTTQNQYLKETSKQTMGSQTKHIQIIENNNEINNTIPFKNKTATSTRLDR